MDVPLLHIADATAERVKAAGLTRVGLLGTRFTMEEEFYRGRLESRHGLSVLTPPADERALVHGIIYGELCLGNVRGESRQAFRRDRRTMAARGAQGVILGCTEIGLLLRPEDAPIPLFDTASIHAEAAADYALEAGAFSSGPPDGSRRNGRRPARRSRGTASPEGRRSHNSGSRPHTGRWRKS